LQRRFSRYGAQLSHTGLTGGMRKGDDDALFQGQKENKVNREFSNRNSCNRMSCNGTCTMQDFFLVSLKKKSIYAQKNEKYPRPDINREMVMIRCLQ